MWQAAGQRTVAAPLVESLADAAAGRKCDAGGVGTGGVDTGGVVAGGPFVGGAVTGGVSGGRYWLKLALFPP